jgi:hypothetical protein
MTDKRSQMYLEGPNYRGQPLYQWKRQWRRRAGRSQWLAIKPGTAGHVSHHRLDVLAYPLGENGFAIIADMAYQEV